MQPTVVCEAKINVRKSKVASSNLISAFKHAAFVQYDHKVYNNYCKMSHDQKMTELQRMQRDLSRRDTPVKRWTKELESYRLSDMQSQERVATKPEEALALFNALTSGTINQPEMRSFKSKVDYKKPGCSS